VREDLAEKVFMEATAKGAHNDCLHDSLNACESCQNIVFAILDRVFKQILHTTALIDAIVREEYVG
jgi:hypothetical protein